MRANCNTTGTTNNRANANVKKVMGMGCGASEEGETKEASSSEEFCRYAKLSSGNRKKLVDYWVNALGYPRDFVSLLVKD